MTSRFFSGVNGTGGHLHDIPLVSLWTDGTLHHAPRSMQRSIARGSGSASDPGATPGTPVFCGFCAITVHGGDQFLHRPENLVAAEPCQQIRDQPLPPERLPVRMVHQVDLDANRPRAEGAGASHIGQSMRGPAPIMIL